MGFQLGQRVINADATMIIFQLIPCSATSSVVSPSPCSLSPSSHIPIIPSNRLRPKLHGDLNRKKAASFTKRGSKIHGLPHLVAGESTRRDPPERVPYGRDRAGPPLNRAAAARRRRLRGGRRRRLAGEVGRRRRARRRPGGELSPTFLPSSGFVSSKSGCVYGSFSLDEMSWFCRRLVVLKIGEFWVH